MNIGMQGPYIVFLITFYNFLSCKIHILSLSLHIRLHLFTTINIAHIL